MIRQIPLGEVPKGIETAKDRVKTLLSDARILLDSKKVESATILTIYSLEEFGKILMLKERCENAIKSGKTFIEIKEKKDKGKKDVFYDHVKKQEKAKTVLPQNTLVIHEGSFDSEAFNSTDFDTNTTLNQDLREALAFTEYYGPGVWTDQRSIDVNKLRNCIEEIEKAVLSVTT